MIAVDTNILIYASDMQAGDKYRLAKTVLSGAMAAGRLVLPLQVLGEFAHVAVRKAKHSLVDVERLVSAWSAVAHVESYHLDDVRGALRVRAEHGLPFWDALIWAVCERCRVPVLVSEDFQDGRALGQVTFLDPFNPANAARLGLTTP